MGKRLFDLTLSVALLVVLILPMGILAWIVCSTSHGNALFLHKRVGLAGREFYVYKFRTMTDGSEGINWNKRDRDPRITPIGRFLRKTSVDELPQLFNVVRGDMSLVGPRPQVWEELHQYNRGMAKRLSVRPGMTGLWQVSGRSDLSWEEKVALDIRYVNEYSLIQDVSILFRTAGVIFGRGAY